MKVSSSSYKPIVFQKQRKNPEQVKAQNEKEQKKALEAYRLKIATDVRPTLKENGEPIEKRLQIDRGSIQELEKDFQEQSKRIKEYISSLDMESYTISYVKGKGVVVRNMKSGK